MGINSASRSALSTTSSSQESHARVKTKPKLTSAEAKTVIPNAGATKELAPDLLDVVGLATDAEARLPLAAPVDVVVAAPADPDAEDDVPDVPAAANLSAPPTTVWGMSDILVAGAACSLFCWSTMACSSGTSPVPLYLYLHPTRTLLSTLQVASCVTVAITDLDGAAVCAGPAGLSGGPPAAPPAAPPGGGPSSSLWTSMACQAKKEGGPSVAVQVWTLFLQASGLRLVGQAGT